MNRYLLLRDNKQSGPFTADELATRGLKAYDLVWLEGKSAAWRYPGEVDELKVFAPLVEEQPFERFYKKPVQDPESRIDHIQLRESPHPSQDLPQAAAAMPGNLISPRVIPGAPAVTSGKVYVKIPAQKNTCHLAVTAPLKTTPPTSTVAPAKNIASVSRFALQPYAAAAIIFSIFLISYLAINSVRQQKNIRELNSIVRRLENKQNQGVQPFIHTSTPSREPVEEAVPLQEPTNEAKHHQPVTHINKREIPPAQAKKSIEIPEAPPTNPGNPAPLSGAAVVSTENLFEMVSVQPNNYKVGILGGIFNLEFEIINNSQQLLRQVAVEIKYLGPEKRVVKTQTIYFENVAPGSRSVKTVPRSKRGVSVDYSITDIKS